MRGKIAMLGTGVRVADIRTAAPAPKRADAELLTAAHRQWRADVLKRAGYRCQWMENGVRCERRAPAYKMVADHIEERADGGALTDRANGQCLCVKHNTLKGLRARDKRQGVQNFTNSAP